MRKILALVAMVIMATVGIALADVSVTGTVNKDKTVTVEETVSIDKTVEINVDVTASVNQASEADSLLNQSNASNEVSSKEKVGYDQIYRTAVITGSVKNNTGIVNLNQEGGNSINQANLINAAISWSEGKGVSGFANAQASMEQVNNDNVIEAVENYLAGPQKQSLISDSIIGNAGMINVNQSVGNMVNQANQIVLAVASEAVVALSEADLGQSLTRNSVTEIGTVRLDSISGSINGNIGIVNVNQSSGNMNNQSNIISISASVPQW